MQLTYSSPSAGNQTRIERELVMRMLENGRAAVVFSVAGYVIAALMLRQHVPAESLMLWLSAVFVASLARLLVVEFGERLFKRLRDRWYANAIMIGIAGVLWGSLALFWHTDMALSGQLAIMLFPVSISLAAVAAYANWIPAFIIFAMPAQLPLVARMLLSPDADLNLIAVAALLLVIGQCVLVKRLHLQLKETLHLQFSNDELLLSMDAHNKELERAHHVADTASKVKGDYLTQLNRELRTPLNSLLGVAAALADSDLDDRQRQHLHELDAAGSTMQRLVDELLEVTLSHADGAELNEVVVRVESVIASVKRAMQAMADAKGLRLSSTIDSGVPEAVVIDAERFRQVIFALVDNAVKFTEVGDVDVRVAVVGTSRPLLRLLVEDSGIGIPDDSKAAVVSRLASGDAAQASDPRISGYGLTRVRRIVALMDGHTDLVSTVGVGTRVMVDLPLVAAASSDAIDIDSDVVGMESVSAPREDTALPIKGESVGPPVDGAYRQAS